MNLIERIQFISMESEVNKNSFDRTFASDRKLVFLPLFVFLGFIVLIAIVIVRVKSDINGDHFGRVPIIIGVCFGLVFLMIILMSVLQCWRISKIFVEINALQLEIRNNDISYWKLWK